MRGAAVGKCTVALTAVLATALVLALVARLIWLDDDSAPAASAFVPEPLDSRKGDAAKGDGDAATPIQIPRTEALHRVDGVPRDVLGVSSLDLGKPPTQLPADPLLPQALPSELLACYQLMKRSLASKEEAVRSGRASKASAQEYARMSAIEKLIAAGRFWYLGEARYAPSPPSSSDVVQYAKLHYATGKVAVFEIHEFEFPGSCSSEESMNPPPASPGRPLGTPMSKEEREAMLLRARERLQKDKKE